MSDAMPNETQNQTAPTSDAPSGSAGLEVEGEAGVFWCARHRKTQTRLRCGRCETPICPKCTVYGPTGARCKSCVSNRGSHMYQVAPQHLVAAIGVSLVLGIVLGFIASFVGLFAILYAPLAGVFMGRAISFVTKNKRGLPLALIASAGLAFGALLPIFPRVLRLLDNVAVAGGEGAFGWGLSSVAFTLIYLVLAIPGAWYWLK